MKAVVEIRDELGDGWLPYLYESKVRSIRTRSYSLNVPQRENFPSIMSTLLGIELKVGRRRFQCPDMATARFLYVFARLGCQQVAVPYDITKISGLADEFEGSWMRMIENLDRGTQRSSPQTKGRIRAALLRMAREEVEKIGAGELMPLFNRSTKQRDA